MKSAIITFHRARNYGSALQAYALNSYLNKGENSAETIDFHTSAQDEMYKIFKKMSSPKDVLYNLLSLVKYRELKLKIKRFDDFVTNDIKLTQREFKGEAGLEELNENFDLFVCGSDQIWNPVCKDFSKAYLLDFVNDKSKCISYAASVGMTDIPEEFKGVFTDLLKDYKAVSVREGRAGEVLGEMLDRQVEIMPDPVVLLNKEQWLQVAKAPKIKGKYILCYYIGDVPGMRDFAKKMSKKSNLPIVVINKNIRDIFYFNKKYYSAGPREFVSLINNAEYICTDSFHAVMFSLILHKNFWIFANQRNNNSSTRIENILNIVGLKDRMLFGNTDGVEYDKKIDFSGIDDIIGGLRSKAENYLDTNTK